MKLGKYTIAVIPCYNDALQFGDNLFLLPTIVLENNWHFFEPASEYFDEGVAEYGKCALNMRFYWFYWILTIAISWEHDS